MQTKHVVTCDHCGASSLVPARLPATEPPSDRVRETLLNRARDCEKWAATFEALGASGDTERQRAADLRSAADALSTLAALRAEVAELKQPMPCGVCLGNPLASGRPCICGGAGTEQAEMHGLRSALFDADAEVDRLRAEVERLSAVTPTNVARACALYMGEVNRCRGSGDEHERAMRLALEDFAARTALSAPPAEGPGR